MPQRRRSFGRRIRSRSKSAPASLIHLFTSNRPSKRKTWTDKQMLAAMKAVEEGLPINQAARDHGIPKTTLKDRISGRVTHGSNPWPKPYLTSSEEKELGDFLKNCAQIEYGKQGEMQWVLLNPLLLTKEYCKEHRSGWRRFLEHQPMLSQRRGDSTAHTRMDAINQETMDEPVLFSSRRCHDGAQFEGQTITNVQRRLEWSSS